MSSAQKRSLPLAARLAAHSESLAACRRCGHGEQVLPIVTEARTPRVMLVGQAPGKTEISRRKPYAGRAGRTLFQWLARDGIDEPTARASIYIAAITRCYPGPSPSGRGDRVPSPREREACAHWLAEELRIIRPRVLVPVGRLAIDRFFGPVPLDEVVGQVREIEHEGGRSRAIALPHPSGASSWIHQSDHHALLDRALAHLRDALRELRIPLDGRSAA